MDAHTFEHNRRVPTERAWGAEHLVNISNEDLFVDPEYYGYCYGLKCVSLEQLIHYKQRRRVPNKDNKDVESIRLFLGSPSYGVHLKPVTPPRVRGQRKVYINQ